jgi:hypothetical protein
MISKLITVGYLINFQGKKFTMDTSGRHPVNEEYNTVMGQIDIIFLIIGYMQDTECFLRYSCLKCITRI